jgi:outer membrane murein-binding lipoprotein Lpp
MKRQRAPYARRSVWLAIAVLSIVLVAGGVAGAYEIHHLQSQVNGLNSQLSSVHQEVVTLYQAILKLAQVVK